MAQNSEGTKSRAASAALVCLLVFVVYNSNLRTIHIDDSVPARVLPFSLLLDHSLSLDRWVEPYFPGARGPYGVYFVAKSRGRWMSRYPIIAPLLLTPLYVASAWWLSRQSPPLVPGDIVLTTLIDTMEKLSASLLAALSVGVLYLALRKIVSPHVSLGAALVYGLASNTWTISSQALWRHGLTELCFAFLLWALLSDSTWSPFWAGLALAVAATNKPPDLTIALPFVVYFARHRRSKLWLFLVPLFVLGSLTLAYNLHFFGRVIGAYPDPLPSAGGSAGGPVIRTSFGDGIAGLLVSPSRGLLIYTPWTVLALWGMARVWKEKMFDWGRYLIVGIAAVFLEHAKFGTWWGGLAFGPRYLTDLLPFFALFLTTLWRRIKSARVMRAVLAISVFAALWVQLIGAYYFPNGWWDLRPVSTDRNPRRLWDWRDTQLSRTRAAGPAAPQFYYDWYLLLNLQNHSGSKQPGSPLGREFHAGGELAAEGSVQTVPLGIDRVQERQDQERGR